MIRVMLADDHEVVRSGLRMLLEQDPGIKVVAEAADGAQAYAVAAREKPDILLMDEPFSAVDAITRSSLQDELKRIHERTGITVLFVTHDIDEAFYLGDRVLVMEAGRAVQYASPHDILSAPAVPFVDRLVAKRRAAYLS